MNGNETRFYQLLLSILMSMCQCLQSGDTFPGAGFGRRSTVGRNCKLTYSLFAVRCVESSLRLIGE